MREFIVGKRQELRYGSDSERLYFYVPDQDKQPLKLGTAPKIAILDPGGDSILAATNMTVVTPNSEGFLTFKTQTAEFSVGAKVTGATSHAIGFIRAIYSYGAVGVLQLDGVDGVFSTGETLTDDGATTGSALADGILWLPLWYYDWDGSAQDPAEAFIANVTYAISTKDYFKPFLFDLVFDPYDPLINSTDIDQEHPDWLSLRDPKWTDWWAAIVKGHVDLTNDIRKRSLIPACFVDREQLRSVELAYIERAISKMCRFSKEDRDGFEAAAAKALGGIGSIKYRPIEADSADDAAEEKIVTGKCMR